MGIQEAFKRGLERISLPVEKRLWNLVSSYPGVAEHVLASNSPILLLGTDGNLTLAKEVAYSTGSNITVVEKDKSTVDMAESAKTNLSYNIASRIEIIHGEFPDVDIPSHYYGLAIAKHLIHFCYAPSIAFGVIRAMNKDGIFFASTPPIIGVRSVKQLEEVGIEHAIEGLGGLLGGIVIVVKKTANQLIF